MKDGILEILQNHRNSFIMDIEKNDLIADEITTHITEFIKWIKNERSNRVSDWMKDNNVNFLYKHWLNNIKK